VRMGRHCDRIMFRVQLFIGAMCDLIQANRKDDTCRLVALNNLSVNTGFKGTKSDLCGKMSCIPLSLLSSSSTRRTEFHLALNNTASWTRRQGKRYSQQPSSKGHSVLAFSKPRLEKIPRRLGRSIGVANGHSYQLTMGRRTIHAFAPMSRHKNNFMAVVEPD
jgi:hypothetical protein